MEQPTKVTIVGNYNKIATESNDLEIKFCKDGDYLLRIRDGKIKRLETIVISDK